MVFERIEEKRMQIIEYDAKYKQDFIDFNTAWIVDNFGFLEDEDRAICRL